MRYKLFTIGYEKLSIKDYIGILLSAEIDILIDVRQTAWSYKRDFCKTSFSKQLTKAIAVVHVPEAGNPKEFRANVISVDTCLRKYRGYTPRN